MTNIAIKKTNQAVVQVLQNYEDETTMPTTPQVDPVLAHRQDILLRIRRRISSGRQTTTNGRDVANPKIAVGPDNARQVTGPSSIAATLRVVDAVPTACTTDPIRGTVATKAKEIKTADNAAPIQKGAINQEPHLPTK